MPGVLLQQKPGALDASLLDIGNLFTSLCCNSNLFCRLLYFQTRVLSKFGIHIDEHLSKDGCLVTSAFIINELNCWV